MINIILGGNKMKRNLDGLLNYKGCEKRTEKSKYFTEKFFEKYPTKYEELLKDYDVLCFSIGVRIKTFEKENIKLDSLVGELELDNDSIEKHYNEFVNYLEEVEERVENLESEIFDLEEELEETEDEEERNDILEDIEYEKENLEDLKRILLNYPKVENFLPLSSALGMSYTFFNKETGEIEDFNRYDEGNEEMIKKLAGSFDDFIDSLYVDEEYVADLRANVDIIQARNIKKAIDEAEEAEDKE